MIEFRNPATVAAPLGPYSQAAIAPAQARWVHVAGQVGVRPDGSVPESFDDQARVAWDNLVAILADAGMTVANLVKVTTYVVDAGDLPRLGPIRAGYLQSARPASTLIIAKALARPEWKIEVEAVACGA